MRIIATESKKEKLSEYAEKMLKYGGKLMQCIEELGEDEFRLMLKEFEYEFEKLDGRIDSIPVEKILDTMGIPKNYMDIINM